MISQGIMHRCIVLLIGDIKKPQQEDVEALCKLLTTVGKAMDNPKNAGFIGPLFDQLKAPLLTHTLTHTHTHIYIYLSCIFKP